MALRLTRMRRLTLVVVGIAAAVLLLGFFLFAAIATRAIEDNSRTADAIVVLTGGSERIGEAARLLRGGRAKKLLISGVNPQTSETAVRRLAGLDAALFRCCVTLGYGAKNTRGNAREARAWQRANKFRSLIVVTAAYHMPRSLVELSQRMPGVELIPHPVLPRRFKSEPWWLHPTNARILAREYIKFLPSAAQYALSRALGSRAAGAYAPRDHANTRP